MALGKGGLCRVPRIRHSAKRVLNFLKKIPLCRVPSQGHLAKTFRKKNYLPSAVSGALGKVFSKKKSLPSSRSGTLGKEIFFLKKNLLCRVPNSRHSAKKDVAEHHYAGHPIPSAAFLPRVWHSAKKSFAECIFLPSAILCRVQHSAKKVFAECPIFDTQQRILHSAESLFSVVIAREPFCSFIILTYVAVNCD